MDIWIGVVQNNDFLREIDIYTAPTEPELKAKIIEVYGEISEDDEGDMVIGESSFPDDRPGWLVTIENHTIS